MKRRRTKKLIAAAIAAVVAAPAVSAADTTLYGRAHIDVRSESNGKVDNYTVNSNTSIIGIKGSEDLGDGLKAVFKYELGYDMADTDKDGALGALAGGKSPLSGRDAYVGLSGGFGTVIAGRSSTPAKIAWYAAGNDHMGDTIADFNEVGFTEFRVDNAIAYISPSFSGFTVAGAIVPGEQKGTVAATTSLVLKKDQVIPGHGTSSAAGAANNDGIADHYSIGLMYAGGGLKASLGYEKVAEVAHVIFKGIVRTTDAKMVQASASYTFGDFTIGGSYEKSSDLMTVKGLDKKVWGISGKANFGNNYVAANYGTADFDAGAVGSDDYTTFAIGVGHKFSKHTQVYAAYSNRDGGGAASPIELNVDYSAFALGMIHTF